MRPSVGVTRCPKDCPRRKPGCHNTNTCNNWRKQVEENKNRLLMRDEGFASKRRSWEERGIRVR